MKNWIIGLGATALVCAGCIIAYPGEFGQHLAGMTLIIAGLQAASWLMSERHRNRKDDQ